MTTRQQLAAAARAAGERYFEDPRGCKRGHVLFYANSAHCVQCLRSDGFKDYAESRKLTGEARDIARHAWHAARQVAAPSLPDRILTCVRGGYNTAAAIGAAVDLTPEHTRRLLRGLETEGLVICGRVGRTHIWRLK